MNTITNKEKTKETRGTYVIPYIEGLSQTFKQIAKRSNFEIAMKSGRKVKDLKTNARHPLGEKRTDVVYKIPSGCGKFEYIGEIERKWASRKKEHQDKVKQTQKDMAENNREQAEKRMNTGDGGLAKPDKTCFNNIQWQESCIIAKESNTPKRKFLESLETTRTIYNKKIPLNTHA